MANYDKEKFTGYGHSGYDYPYGKTSIEEELHIKRYKDFLHEHKIVSNMKFAPAKPEIKTITVEAAIAIVNSDTPVSGQDVIDALMALKKAGWEFRVNPALAHGDRSGYQISILAPKT